MPNKRDEVLYHLNENREVHEKHATQKAKEILKSRGDSPAGSPKSAAGKSIRAECRQGIREGEAGQNRAAGTKKAPAKKEKKKSHGMKIIFSLLLVGVAFAVADRGLFESSHRTVSTGKGLALDIYEISTDDSLVVGEDLPAGTYTAVLEEGIATLSLNYGMETERWEFQGRTAGNGAVCLRRGFDLPVQYGSGGQNAYAYALYSGRIGGFGAAVKYFIFLFLFP